MRGPPLTPDVRPAYWHTSPRRGAPPSRARGLGDPLPPCRETPCPETPCPETRRFVQRRRRSVGSPWCGGLRSVAWSARGHCKSRMHAAASTARRRGGLGHIACFIATPSPHPRHEAALRPPPPRPPRVPMRGYPACSRSPASSFSPPAVVTAGPAESPG